MALFLDIAVVLIIVITFVVVLLRGFIKTILDFASVVFAIVFAKMFSASFSNMFYASFNRFFSEGIGNVVSNFLSKNELPEFLEQENISELLGKYNIELANIINTENINNGFQVIVESIVGLLSYAVAFLLIFVITIIAFKILSLILCKVFKLPVLKTINKTMSLILAVVMCFVYLNLFIAFMQIIIPVVSSVYPETINATVIESTYLFKFFYGFEWIKFLVN